MKQMTREAARINPRSRPTRASYGMTATAHLRRHKLDGDALGLSVKGTLDSLSNMFRFYSLTIRGDAANAVEVLFDADVR